LYNSLRVSEVGITDDLVYEMIDFQRKLGLPYEAYINFGYNEKVSGADIELVIFDGKGSYHTYFLQAKRMMADGDFKIDKFDRTLPPPPDPMANQYLKLISYAGKRGIPLYLLYCGQTKGSTKGTTDYGLSVVTAETIAFHMEVRCTTGIPTFDELFDYIPASMFKVGHKPISIVPPSLSGKIQIHPFSCLFCENTPEHLVPTPKALTKKIEIEAPYQKIFLSDTNDEEREDKDFIYDETAAGMPLYKIIFNGES
jgi:hypothetical protein